MNLNFLKNEERIALTLKALYKSYGFAEYKLSGFEDYSVYAENKSFLDGKGVLTFNTGGKLFALRPDVTLSVIKNVAADGETKKLFYDERVYRKITGNRGFSELRQIGVEVIGEIDGVAEAEVSSLMLKTLQAVGKNCVLDVSHTGVIVKILDGLKLSAEDRRFSMTCLIDKNAHDFAAFAKANGLDGGFAQAFEKLISLSAEPSAALAEMRGFAAYAGIEAEIAELEDIVRAGGGMVNINFSVGGDADYYNGAVFKGYIEGVPHAVLSGGRYDKLLNKFGKSAQALGFALYLGELGKYFIEKPDVPDAVLIYSEKSAESALKKAEELRAQGVKLLLSRVKPQDFIGEIYYAEDGND